MHQFVTITIGNELTDSFFSGEVLWSIRCSNRNCLRRIDSIEVKTTTADCRVVLIVSPSPTTLLSRTITTSWTNIYQPCRPVQAVVPPLHLESADDLKLPPSNPTRT